MESIKVDSDVFAYLQKHARPFVDTPNSTLRRLLGIDNAIQSPRRNASTLVVDGELDQLSTEALVEASNRTKAPKANLGTLIQSGFLRNGETLFLVDYQGNKVQQFQAVISGSDLLYSGQRYSMSNLAKELLAKVGFKSNSVRGPAHWVSEGGKTVKDLWQQYLDRNIKE